MSRPSNIDEKTWEFCRPLTQKEKDQMIRENVQPQRKELILDKYRDMWNPIRRREPEPPTIGGEPPASRAATIKRL